MIPTSWAGVTIGQYQAMSNVISKKMPDIEQRISLANIFIGERADKLTISELIHETDKLSFVTAFPSEKMFYGFELEGRKFTVNVIAQTLTSGQYIDLTALLKDPAKINDNLHNIMAVISTEAKGYEGYIDNGKLFREKLTMDKVYPASAFFLRVMERLIRAMRGYLTMEIKKAVQRELATEPTISTGGGM